MKFLIILIYLSLLCWCLHKLFTNTERKETEQEEPEQLIYTADMEEALDKVQRIREQLHKLERLQIELDIANMDNCFARSISLNWGNGSDDEYVLMLTESDSEDFQKVIDKERQRLTSSLQSELSKITGAVKSKGDDKTKNKKRDRGA